MKKILIIYLILTVNANLLFSMGRMSSTRLKGKIICGTGIVDLETGEKNIVKKSQKGGYVNTGLLSPDGKRIVFDYVLGTANNYNKGYELRIIDIDGQNERTLLYDRYGFSYTWSPDSKFLAATGIGMLFEYLIISPSSSEFWRLEIPESKVKGLTQPYWTKEGRSIMLSVLLNEKEERVALIKINLNGQNFQIITYLPKLMSMDVLSPDEKKIGFTGWDEGLYVLNLQTSETKLIPKNRKFKTFPFWSPDSEWIGCKLEDNFPKNGEFSVWNIETGERRNLPLSRYDLIIQWWAPWTKAPVDCEKIIKEMLGPGQKLETLK